MPRYKLNIEYDGSGFVGWQRQANGMSVQQTLEDAVRAFSGETVTLFGAGRTDSGVHALGQVAHFDLSRNFTSDKVRDALNFHVRPQAVGVTAAAAGLACARTARRGRHACGGAMFIGQTRFYHVSGCPLPG